MTERFRSAWNTLHLYPFGPDFRDDLIASNEDNGRLGFGKPPEWTCQEKQRIPKATGWRPGIASLGYSSLGIQAPHRITVRVIGQAVEENKFKAGTVVPNTRWQQVIFDEPLVTFVYLRNVPIVVDDQTGVPYGIHITTVGRTGPSMVVLDWNWARFLRDDDRRHDAECP